MFRSALPLRSWPAAVRMDRAKESQTPSGSSKAALATKSATSSAEPIQKMIPLAKKVSPIAKSGAGGPRPPLHGVAASPKMVPTRYLRQWATKSSSKALAAGVMKHALVQRRDVPKILVSTAIPRVNSASAFQKLFWKATGGVETGASNDAVRDRNRKED